MSKKENHLKKRQKNIECIRNLENEFFDKSRLKEDLQYNFITFTFFIFSTVIYIFLYAKDMIYTNAINIDQLFFSIDLCLLISCSIFNFLVHLAIYSNNCFLDNYKILKKIIIDYEYQPHVLQECANYYSNKILQFNQGNTIFFGVILPIIISFTFSFNFNSDILLFTCIILVMLIYSLMNIFKILGSMKDANNIYNFKFLQQGIHQYFHEQNVYLRKSRRV